MFKVVVCGKKKPFYIQLDSEEDVNNWTEEGAIM